MKRQKKRMVGQAMTEYAMLIASFSLWTMAIYELLMKQFSNYLNSIYFVLNLALP